jgi:protein-tyrosine phosphatase
MRTELYWVPGTSAGRIAIMPRPRGGDWLEDEVRAWRDAGVDVVVSLLEADEVMDLELLAEEGLARANRIEFVRFPITDRGVPESRDAAAELANRLANLLGSGKNVAIHCRQGIGRAALVAIAVMIRLGVDAGAAIERVSAARGLAVPETPAQRQWLLDFARQSAKPTPA